ncbi:B12-binding domain-containing radical SAM protein [Acidobacteriota bacterium]
MSPKKNEILLIHAGIGNCGFNSYGKGMDESWVNHGLACINAYLKLQAISSDYLDMRKLKNWRHFQERIKELQPKIVGISATTVDVTIALKAAKLIKSIDTKIVSVIGGIHASVCPDVFGDSPHFDQVVIGEGEMAFTDIISHTTEPGVIHGKSLANLDNLPFIDRSVFGDKEAPLYAPLFPSPFYTFISSRGCPFNCSFCQPAEKILFGKKMRSRSPENLVEEIKECQTDRGMQSYLIHDDCLLWNPDWVEEFAETLSIQKVSIPFAVQSRADLICKNPKLVSRLAMQGLRMVLIGFESGSQKVLDFLRKGTTVEQNILAAEICQNNGIAIWANYMFGTPGETATDIERTVHMIKTIRPEVHSPSFFVPYPGTDLSTYCTQKGLSLVQHSNDFRRNPEGEKIKGVDYRLLRKAIWQAQDVHPLIFQLKKWKHRLKSTLKI